MFLKKAGLFFALPFCTYFNQQISISMACQQCTQFMQIIQPFQFTNDINDILRMFHGQDRFGQFPEFVFQFFFCHWVLDCSFCELHCPLMYTSIFQLYLYPGRCIYGSGFLKIIINVILGSLSHIEYSGISQVFLRIVVETVASLYKSQGNPESAAELRGNDILRNDYVSSGPHIARFLRDPYLRDLFRYNNAFLHYFRDRLKGRMLGRATAVWFGAC